MATPDEIATRAADAARAAQPPPAAQDAPLSLEHLPLADLVRFLADRMLPNGDTFLLPHSVSSAATSTPVWTGLAYAANYADAGAPWAPGQWGRDSSGFIQLRGLVLKSNAWVAGETIATLPAGARPGNTEVFTSVAADVANGRFVARLQINPAGQVVFVDSYAPPIAAPGQLQLVSLSAMSFYQVN